MRKAADARSQENPHGQGSRCPRDTVPEVRPQDPAEIRRVGFDEVTCRACGAKFKAAKP
jgi:hypothetical protein